MQHKSQDQVSVIIFQFLNHFWVRTTLNLIPSVDSFFLIGGCLLGYLTFKDMDRTKGWINLILFYTHRYIRWSINFYTSC